jgi:hypothetical protein
MRIVLVPILLAAVALGGCTTSSTSSSTKFTGASADVSKAVGDLQSAGQRKDSTKLCTQLFSRELVAKFDSGGTNCKDEMDKALADADEFTLDVQNVTVDGSNAKATVRQGDKGPTRVVDYVREDNAWKVSGFPAG